MDMRQLKYFVQIVESGSLSKASLQLFVAQPSLSQQMARLEEEVGRVLLVRSVRGVRPTPNGEALYHHAKFMLRQLDEAVAVAQQDLEGWTGRVTLGLPPTTVHVVGLPLVKHLKLRYPGITLNVVEALSAQLEDMIDYFAKTGNSCNHAVGTCKMGNDAMAVVDARLRVHGVDRLRIIDASIMPNITAGNTNAASMMIGEKGADLLRDGMLPRRTSSELGL